LQGDVLEKRQSVAVMEFAVIIVDANQMVSCKIDMDAVHVDILNDAPYRAALEGLRRLRNELP